VAPSVLDEVERYLVRRDAESAARLARALALDEAARATGEEREADRAHEMRWRRERVAMRPPMETPAVPVKEDYVWSIVDYEAIPLDRLKPYLDPKAVAAAIETAITMGMLQLSGVRIEPAIGGATHGRLRRATRESPAHHRRRTPNKPHDDRRPDHRGLARR
jgi:hypothetical protein